MKPKVKDSLKSLLFGFVPLPIFINFANAEFIYNCPAEDQPLVPLNIGTIILAASFFWDFLHKLFSSKISFRSGFGFISLCVFCVYYMSIGGDFLRMVQMILPLLFLYMVCLSGERFKIGPFFFFPMVFFVFLHILSYATSEMEGIDKFTNISDFCVYQSLVTYPSVLSLFSLIVLFFMRSRCRFFIFSLVWVLNLLSQRKLAMLDFSILSVVFVVFSNRNRPIVILTLLAILMVDYFLEVDLFGRFFDSVSANDVSSGRSDILSDFFANFDIGSINFYLGYNVTDKPGLHNFILNTIYSTGLIGLVLYFVPLLTALVGLLKDKLDQYESLYVFCVFTLLCTSAMINSSITQPYFVSNFILAFFIWRSKCSKTENCS